MLMRAGAPRTPTPKPRSCAAIAREPRVGLVGARDAPDMHEQAAARVVILTGRHAPPAPRSLEQVLDEEEP